MDYTGYYVLSFVLLLIMLAFLYSAIKIVPPYAVGVVMLFGSYRGTLGPGFNIVNPNKIVKIVDLRSQTHVLPPALFATASGAPVNIDGRVEFHVTDAPKSLFQTKDVTGTLLAEFREAVAFAVASMPFEGILASGWQVARSVRSTLSSSAEKYGVGIDRIGVRVWTPAGPVEFFDGKSVPAISLPGRPAVQSTSP